MEVDLCTKIIHKQQVCCWFLAPMAREPRGRSCQHSGEREPGVNTCQVQRALMSSRHKGPIKLRTLQEGGTQGWHRCWKRIRSTEWEAGEGKGPLRWPVPYSPSRGGLLAGDGTGISFKARSTFWLLQKTARSSDVMRELRVPWERADIYGTYARFRLRVSVSVCGYKEQCKMKCSRSWRLCPC